MFSKDHFIERETSFHILGIFSIFIVVTIITSSINIEKSFAVEKETAASLPSANSDSSKISTILDNFFNCITNAVKKNGSSQMPKFFNNEPTKTEIAICFKQTKQAA